MPASARLQNTNLATSREQLSRLSSTYYLAEENSLVESLIEGMSFSPALDNAIEQTAIELVEHGRRYRESSSGIQAFLDHYDLSSHEGVVLMCIAEALLRIPDNATIDDLISDKLSSANWMQHIGESDSLFVNASTWALMLGAQTLKPGRKPLSNPTDYLAKLVSRMEEPVMRAAMKTAMGIMAKQFVMGRNISEALSRSSSPANSAYRYSFDMLGEAAITAADADRYFDAYAEAIAEIGRHAGAENTIEQRPGISIKLSALYPRYEYRHCREAERALSNSLLSLATLAKKAGIGLTVDAEEADRLEMSLRVFGNVYCEPRLKGWHGLGLAIQAYQKRALAVLRWLQELSIQQQETIPVRLVKGAYWDNEIKQAQELGHSDYPVFTRKSNTDLSYLACARFLLEDCHFIFPQFATHNAQTISYIYHHGNDRDYEFQRLHGMGEELYSRVVDINGYAKPCRVYAPVGAHEDLLPYLVRRLLENGANTSFVNQMAQHRQDTSSLVTNPLEETRQLQGQYRHPRIVLPVNMYGKSRPNSHGTNLADMKEQEALTEKLACEKLAKQSALPILDGLAIEVECEDVINPANGEIVGQRGFCSEADLSRAFQNAVNAWPAWNNTPVRSRARLLQNTAELFEENRAQFLALLVKESGKTIVDAEAEIREAIDFLYYYAAQAKRELSRVKALPGPTGESNELRLCGRGVFLCISPWNFPLAIFTGQLAAALVAGNTVLAKPAEQGCLVAAHAMDLWLKAGLPAGVMQFIPAEGERTGEVLLKESALAGVCFTGSTATAQLINRRLAQRDGAIAKFIAETGGQNVMIADSSALPEQLVRDVVQSAFYSAGQRCSALRVLYVQEDIADTVLNLLKGHMDTLVIDDPAHIETDIGPLIDKPAMDSIIRHIDKCRSLGKVIHECGDLPGKGNFIAPVVIKVDGIEELEKEHFGPVLHFASYRHNELDDVIRNINKSGYGLTLGVHSRIEQRASYIRDRVHVGNVYVNRNITGAVVGTQPFGGQGLSGTGPKAGGPAYLRAFTTEQVFTVNTSAIGGNASLLALGD